MVLNLSRELLWVCIVCRIVPDCAHFFLLRELLWAILMYCGRL